MYETYVEPRFSETDALAHVGNTVLPVWFEDARNPIFRKIHPSMEASSWPLILAHLDVDFVKQIFIGYTVTIKTQITKIGTKSFTVYQEAWQRDELAAKGSAVMVYFDFRNELTVEIPSNVRSLLEEFTEGHL